MQNGLPYTSALVATSAIVLCTAAYGQALEEVIVTAQKRAESLQDVPISVAAVGGDALEAAAITDLSQLSLTLPNVTIVQEQISDRINIRGIASGGNQGFDQSVGLFSNGVYLGRGTQYRSAFLDVERVEILRGPQATLFGRNTIAGAVSVTPRLPEQELAAELRARHEAAFGSQSLAGFLNGGITDTLSARVAFRLTEEEGFVDNVLLDRDEPSGESDNVRASLLWEPVDNLSVNLSYEQYNLELDGKGWEISIDEAITILPGSTIEDPLFTAVSGCQPVFTDCEGDYNTGSTNVDGSAFFDQEELSDVETSLTALNIEYGIGDYTLNLVTGYSTSRLFEINPGAGLVIPTTNTNQFEDYHAFTQEIRLTSPGDQAFDWLAGLYYEDNDFFLGEQINLNDASLLGGTVGTNVAINQDFEQTGEIFAIFGQGTWNVSDTFRMTFGMRFSSEEKRANQRYALNDAARDIRLADYFVDVVGLPRADAEAAAFGLAAGFNLEEHAIPTQTFTQDNFTPSINLQWDATDSLMVYLSGSIGFKSGGFDARIALDDAADGIVNDEEYAERFQFEEEQATAYELGLKSSLLGGAAELNAAVFYTQYEDLQFSAFNGGLSFLVDNAADVNLIGAEFEGRWQLTDSLLLSGGGSFLNFEYQSFPNAPCDVYRTLTAASLGQAGCVTDFEGETGVNTPDFSFNLNLDWAREIGFGLRARLGATLIYEDDFFVERDLDEALRQEAYAKLNLRAGLSGAENRWSLSLIAQNVTDEQTFHYGNDVPLFNGTRFVRLDPPRTVTLELVLRY
ncbi:MAG: TonB-dependent receptor [Pseudomonadota bacterium]